MKLLKYKALILCSIILLVGCNKVPETSFKYPDANVEIEQIEFGARCIRCSQIQIKTEPRDALVYVLQGENSFRHNKKPYHHTTPINSLWEVNREEKFQIIVYKEGYYPYKTTLYLQREDLIKLNIVLIKG